MSSLRGAIVSAGLAVLPMAVAEGVGATDADRVLAVREGKTQTVADGAMSFTVLKIRGYSIDVRIDGVKHKVKVGDSLPATGQNCRVLFRKVSPETRIARFLTNCR